MNNCDLKTDSDQECQAACENTVGCVEFTWIEVAEFDAQETKHSCCLKRKFHKDQNIRASPGSVSGPKNCDGEFLPKLDLLN